MFPVRKDIYRRWAGEYREAVRKMDFIAQWHPEGTFLDAYEQAFLDQELPEAVRGKFHALEPVGAPWLRPLADLRWLVISAFCQTISRQLHKLTKLNIFHGVPAESLARIAATCHLLPCPFHNNRPNSTYDREVLVAFFDRVFQSPLKPIAQRRWFFGLTKWRFAKRNKLSGE